MSGLIAPEITSERPRPAGKKPTATATIAAVASAASAHRVSVGTRLIGSR
jgi:hypothetical protein